MRPKGLGEKGTGIVKRGEGSQGEEKGILGALGRKVL